MECKYFQKAEIPLLKHRGCIQWNLYCGQELLGAKILHPPRWPCFSRKIMNHVSPHQFDPRLSPRTRDNSLVSSPAELGSKLPSLLLPRQPFPRFLSPALTGLLLGSLRGRRPWRALRLLTHRRGHFSLPPDDQEQVPIHRSPAAPGSQRPDPTSKQPRAADALPVPFYWGRLEMVCSPLVFRSFSSKEWISGVILERAAWFPPS